MRVAGSRHDRRTARSLCRYADERVASTVVLIRTRDVRSSSIPGWCPHRSKILDPLAGLGVDPAEVGDVVFSHHHPDHTLNAALFERARFHDFWAIYEGTPGPTGRPTDSSSRRR